MQVDLMGVGRYASCAIAGPSTDTSDLPIIVHEGATSKIKCLNSAILALENARHIGQHNRRGMCNRLGERWVADWTMASVAFSTRMRSYEKSAEGGADTGLRP